MHTFSYKSREGKFCLNGGNTYVDQEAYSGNSTYYNDETAQHLKNQGPIPVNTWKVTAITDKKGKHTLVLAEENVKNSYGRDGFLIHGDNQKKNHTASEGCIIVGPTIRKQIKKNDLIEVNNDI
ncbi:hypothetical protein RFI_22607 [Reticulomyxa filosa]|uniref:Tlde1 domain-containing protein n=1 Tax=Reticulomyxa filosa TaxID=46433 RepID=X6MM83_RETFI|nr:hypothetical protein RFI_22607 [Reticulomyxa filosa]|eukprot:ETO14761.1 hypothetical protein RFI_22607 [Reticulomyxa filosa]